MNEIIKIIMERRSIRRFRPEQIPGKELELILQAGLYAPSAGGRQGVFMVVSQNREVNERLGRIKKKNTHVTMSDAQHYISKEQPSIADDPGIASGFYDAPTVITLFAPKQFLYSVNDCSVAAENMMLAAASLGIGSCLIGAGWESFADPYGNATLVAWGVRTDYYAVCHVVLGYPREESPPLPKPRKEGRILYR